jgi:hypothetical protein
MACQLIELILLADPFGGQLLVSEEGVVGLAVCLHQQRLTTLGPGQVPRV